MSLETTQRAYRHLGDEGIVVARVGRGTRIASGIDAQELGLRRSIDDLVARARQLGITRPQLEDWIASAFAEKT